ncbi:M56 family metallopeptidase [Nocardioides sp. zg-536]|uniref:M56 family metallopeptidase n=1 Tax=Nocardioides faecalis TaxID=2803858 RepID=A0A938Y6C7_9ACTN|nr:M56 family metallopeptidase [Nocardioides faecalis]MBM9460085.1 M56 family metallopeptidase [Nocardioides faecalis]MBS4754184.1 M56 family metallopeptidase [Nocardioides faecalis]QVI60118.1 M56 family metallopeptidase [Nocardioides faecalis]
MTTLVLAVLALALAGPVPAVLVRWTALRRTPAAAVVLWQAIAAAAVLAALGAGLSLVTQHTWGDGWREDAGPFGYAVAGTALLLTLVVAGRLLLSGHRVGTELRTLRRRHRRQLDLLAERRDGVQVLEHDVPVAYCVPGLAGSRVVVSAGALGRLDRDEYRAVLAHERAHLAARHDLVLEAFSVLHRAFPRWVSSSTVLGEVKLLVEVLADRAAVHGRDPRPLARALVELAAGRAPAAAMGAGGAGLVERVELLADSEPHRVQGVGVLCAAVAVLALPTAFVVAPWLSSLG